MGQTHTKNESATKKTVLEIKIIVNNELKTTNNEFELLLLIQ